MALPSSFPCGLSRGVISSSICNFNNSRVDGSPPGSPVPGILQARTRVGCHFLLQCMKVKSESEVAQSCPTLSDPMDCSLPGSSIHGIFQARVLEWGAVAFSKFIQSSSLLHAFLWLNNVNRRRQWQPTPVLLPGKSHGPRSLVGCSPLGR